MSKPVLSGLFRFSGRRNRKSFVLNRLLSWSVLMLLWVGLGFAASDTPDVHPRDSPDAFLLFALALTVVYAVSSWAVCAQRARDLGWTGWTVLILYMPVFGVVAYLYLLFKRGIAGNTEYGPDPLVANRSQQVP